MDRPKINKINVERLNKWKSRLNDEHATPVVMVGVGHDHKNGRIVLCTTEDMNDFALMTFMQTACKMLEEKFVKKN